MEKKWIPKIGDTVYEVVMNGVIMKPHVVIDVSVDECDTMVTIGLSLDTNCTYWRNISYLSPTLPEAMKISLSEWIKRAMVNYT